MTQIKQSNIEADAVGTTEIATDAVTTNEIATNAVTTNELATAEQMTTTNVLAKTAAASNGAVGTYAFLQHASYIVTSAGTTRAGSELRYSGIMSTTSSGNPVTGGGSGSSNSGTWLCMGNSSYDAYNTRYGITLWLRIS